GAAGGALLSQEVVERGPRGHVGPAGPKGDTGNAGVFDTQDILNAIDADPKRVAEAIQNDIDAKVIQPQLRPDPQDVRDDVRDLCHQLEETEALRDAAIGCP
ncbi:MAG TPA: hypothetical protein VJT75_13100, partial [Thermoleophilaceae bacterium]|nr:hypothetical protein [Thermoleophilaceae bacterium]